ncbi:hypothetical protein IB642_06350 [Allofrancisella guangzhouensis]|uniref:Uncharacterized protein n=1 Tax=Allofrancisella guangzhouensis TaxID=594679 RepID=A0A0A8EAU5_9GAMM|nr:hypothetical protein [Allofrancisella guangzhouensis]AJC49306.1 hypothetical protein SD28_06530 [Allofrancisella guangzhouensis]MBK2027205.1 hypothetical protein [Allofrancisella guangzhouensis]MBK2044641.1 hypothetical protein [Allofrancisella guangzhouensis]MBK2045076.1 hypothetical protein [Allofrancisella guangzhouensis]
MEKSLGSQNICNECEYVFYHTNENDHFIGKLCHRCNIKFLIARKALITAIDKYISLPKKAGWIHYHGNRGVRRARELKALFIKCENKRDIDEIYNNFLGRSFIERSFFKEGVINRNLASLLNGGNTYPSSLRSIIRRTDLKVLDNNTESIEALLLDNILGKYRYEKPINYKKVYDATTKIQAAWRNTVFRHNRSAYPFGIEDSIRPLKLKSPKMPTINDWFVLNRFHDKRDDVGGYHVFLFKIYEITNDYIFFKFYEEGAGLPTLPKGDSQIEFERRLELFGRISSVYNQKSLPIQSALYKLKLEKSIKYFFDGCIPIITIQDNVVDSIVREYVRKFIDKKTINKYGDKLPLHSYVTAPERYTPSYPTKIHNCSSFLNYLLTELSKIYASRDF